MHCVASFCSAARHSLEVTPQRCVYSRDVVEVLRVELQYSEGLERRLHRHDVRVGEPAGGIERVVPRAHSVRTHTSATLSMIIPLSGIHYHGVYMGGNC